MSPALKNLLGLAIVVSLLGFLYFGFSITKTYNRSSEPTNFRSFTVQGDGKAVGVPDVASFTFQVITEGDEDLAKLQSENAAKMNAVIDFVAKQGIDKKDISTTQYSINPRYENVICDYRAGSVCPPAEIVGYTVQQMATLKIRDFKLTSSLLTGVVENGANTVSDIQFSLDNPTEVENMARAEAIEKAKAKAKSIAEAGGFSLGRLLEISEGYISPSVSYGRGGGPMMDAVSTKEMAIAPAIEAGSQEVQIQVYLKYEIR
ncbi:SIMPL domain-containing protein [Candidatus Gracilibacteria bacterium]|nr:SIMPL domain-containing protein [Candidatus Gracilibacteria bacterium]